MDFLYVHIYLLKLQTDYVVLGGNGQACVGMAKEAIKKQNNVI